LRIGDEFSDVFSFWPCLCRFTVYDHTCEYLQNQQCWRSRLGCLAYHADLLLSKTLGNLWFLWDQSLATVLNLQWLEWMIILFLLENEMISVAVSTSAFTTLRYWCYSAFISARNLKAGSDEFHYLTENLMHNHCCLCAEKFFNESKEMYLN
jgi:hypothetical protein